MHNTRALIEVAYPFWSSITALVIAQVLKPFCFRISNKEWVPLLVFSSGGFPSSHSATVAALTLSVGFQEHFSSTLFAVALIFAIIVVYDAANVRYYSGKNIEITQQLIKDLQELSSTRFDDPIYFTKIKNVLGHKWSEVISGIIIGIAIALLYRFVF